jgi:hypothetical protein
MAVIFDKPMSDEDQLDFLMSLLMLFVEKAGGTLTYGEDELRRIQSGRDYRGLKFEYREFRLATHLPAKITVKLEKHEVIETTATDETGGEAMKLYGKRVQPGEKFDLEPGETAYVDIELDLPPDVIIPPNKPGGFRVIKEGEMGGHKTDLLLDYSSQDRDGYDIDQLTGPRPNPPQTCSNCGCGLAAWVLVCPACGAGTPASFTMGIDVAGFKRDEETRTGGERGGGKTNRLLRQGDEATQIKKRPPVRNGDSVLGEGYKGGDSDATTPGFFRPPAVSFTINAGTKTCIHCGRPCVADAVTCPSCGETLNADESPLQLPGRKADNDESEQ